jgi:hypothetical protein
VGRFGPPVVADSDRADCESLLGLGEAPRRDEDGARRPVEQPFADGSRQDQTKAAAMRRAEHDHIGALVLGELVQGARRRHPAHQAQPEAGLPERPSGGGGEAVLGFRKRALVCVGGSRERIEVLEHRREDELGALGRSERASEREGVARRLVTVVADENAAVHRRRRLDHRPGGGGTRGYG